MWLRVPIPKPKFINVLRTVNLQIFRQINVADVKFKKYLLQNYETGQVIAWINEQFLKIPAPNLNSK